MSSSLSRIERNPARTSVWSSARTTLIGECTPQSSHPVVEPAPARRDHSDSVLSKQVAVLEKAGYVKVTKGYVGKRPRTWPALTREGHAAFKAHCQALRAIAGDA
ncbi:transcriptional regulator [Actinoallomurus vinaceus]|uniref:transcriptional regulator n=1 Tax=Actinoallomurus vinaceus TaxID=1080074 RepID=UPI0031E9556F